ncbi:MAG: hypothetical protein ACYS9Y_10945 [Planctomycetota bacterium]|jgi:sulfite reductase beta subunit-like hemoprotein
MNSKTEEQSRYRARLEQTTNSKMLGVYPQRQEGLHMQRVKIFEGRINWLQWRRIAKIASVYTSGTALHITTRQSIELHNIASEDVATVQRDLAEVGLSVFGAGGDSVRNITVCSGCQFDPNASDVFGLAKFVRQYLEQKPMIFNLPRKFKISFSGCRLACAKPWINDLGFIAQRDGFFTVIGAGSLGAKPALGIELYKNLPTKDVLALCISAIEFFKDHGDRKNRHRARFRHVREKLGDNAFRTELDVRFNRLRLCRSWSDFLPAKSNRNIKLLWHLQLPNGNIVPKDAVELADIAEPEEALLRINLEHALELYGTKTFQLPEHLALLEKNPVIVSCPGSSTCNRAIADSWALADRIRNILVKQGRPKTHINISACPNSCAHSTISEIGLVGMRSKQNGRCGECYRLYKAGGGGKSNSLAQKSEILSVKGAPKAVAYFIESARL